MRDRAVVARKAHNLEVVSSSLAPATKKKTGLKSRQLKNRIEIWTVFKELKNKNKFGRLKKSTYICKTIKKQIKK